MFKKILYPTDFSEIAQVVIKYIEQLKSAGAQEVLVLHVIDSRSFDLLAYNPSVSMEFEKNLREDAQGKMDAVKSLLEDMGFEVKTRIELGTPSRVILKAEEQEDLSLIVIGSHGKSNIREMLLGSVSEEVIRSAQKPVLVVKR